MCSYKALSDKYFLDYVARPSQYYDWLTEYLYQNYTSFYPNFRADKGGSLFRKNEYSITIPWGGPFVDNLCSSCEFELEALFFWQNFDLNGGLFFKPELLIEYNKLSWCGKLFESVTTFFLSVFVKYL